MNRFEGGCHCGNLRFVFTTALPIEALVPRACDCSFCRKHDARALSDPAGRLKISVADAGYLVRYRFGKGFTDFLICRRCGVYIGAFMPDGDAAYANVMVNAFDTPGTITRVPVTVHRSTEDAMTKRRRRRANWTPATLSSGSPTA
ncbi:MAG: aldehyde-activating protein [Betaproteobacteria bacterium]|nr:aldehyde-activating protein [Betaproteobacteria bacterium]